MADDADQKRAAARVFGEAAAGYLESETHRQGADLERIVSWCAEATRALDVATGAGHTAAAIAARDVPTVVALDAAPAMVATARAAAASIDGCVGDAERLPFSADSFDAVACRIAAHHFPDPAAFVNEVARVLRPGGTFAFEDNVVPPDPSVGTFLNRLEAARDHTHVRSHAIDAWRRWLSEAGFSIVETRRRANRLAFEPWVDRIDPSAREDADRIERTLLTASPAVTVALGVRAERGRVESFLSPKVLFRAVLDP